MAGSRSQNTQAEALRSVLGQIADMKVMPDADIPFLTNMETMLLGYLRAPFEAQQAGQSMSAPGAAAGIGAAQALPPMQTPAAGGLVPALAAGQRVPGVMNAPSMPPVDELRRLLGK